jgi:hypothetical protein
VPAIHYDWLYRPSPPHYTVAGRGLYGICVETHAERAALLRDTVGVTGRASHQSRPQPFADLKTTWGQLVDLNANIIGTCRATR